MARIPKTLITDAHIAAANTASGFQEALNAESPAVKKLLKSAVVVQQVIAPEPDHSEELETQRVYEELRDGGIAEKAAGERRLVAQWERDGATGPRPATPSIDALMKLYRHK